MNYLLDALYLGFAACLSRVSQPACKQFALKFFYAKKKSSDC